MVEKLNSSMGGGGGGVKLNLNWLVCTPFMNKGSYLLKGGNNLPLNDMRPIHKKVVPTHFLKRGDAHLKDVDPPSIKVAPIIRGRPPPPFK